MVKNSPANVRDAGEIVNTHTHTHKREMPGMKLQFLCWKIPLRRKWQPTPAFLPVSHR